MSINGLAGASESAASRIATSYETQNDPKEGEVGHAIFHFGGGNLITTFTEGNFQLQFNPTACSGAPTSQGKLIITGGTGIKLGAKGSLIASTIGYIIGARMPFPALILLTFASHILIAQ